MQVNKTEKTGKRNVNVGGQFAFHDFWRIAEFFGDKLPAGDDRCLCNQQVADVVAFLSKYAHEIDIEAAPQLYKIEKLDIKSAAYKHTPFYQAESYIPKQKEATFSQKWKKMAEYAALLASNDPFVLVRLSEIAIPAKPSQFNTGKGSLTVTANVMLPDGKEKIAELLSTALDYVELSIVADAERKTLNSQL